MDAKVTWSHGLSFEGTATSGFKLPLGSSVEGGGENDGFRPLELLLIGLAGCTGMDVISILEKKRQEVTAFEVRVQAERGSEYPRIFTKIEVEYVVSGKNLEKAAVDRAVELSVTKYCAAQAMLSKASPVEHKITILEA
jgi:putative redox protein